MAAASDKTQDQKDQEKDSKGPTSAQGDYQLSRGGAELENPPLGIATDNPKAVFEADRADERPNDDVAKNLQAATSGTAAKG